MDEQALYEIKTDTGAALEHTIQLAKQNKPGDRSELDRKHAIFITELEKIQGYYEAVLKPKGVNISTPEVKKAQVPYGQPQLDPMAGLIEGRIVHFVMPDGQHRPAIVVRVWYVAVSDGPEPIKAPPENGVCQLQVFSDGTNDLPYHEAEEEAFRNAGLDEAYVRRGIIWKTSVLYSEACAPGTWHWIERA